MELQISSNITATLYRLRELVRFAGGSLLVIGKWLSPNNPGNCRELLTATPPSIFGSFSHSTMAMNHTNHSDEMAIDYLHL